MSLATDAGNLLDSLFAGTLVPGLNPTVPVTLIATTAGTYDPATGVNTQVETSTATKAIPRRYTLREIAQSGGALHVGDVEMKFRAVQPSQGDSVVWGSKRLRVESVRQVQMGSDALLWIATCREG